MNNGFLHICAGIKLLTKPEFKVILLNGVYFNNAYVENPLSSTYTLVLQEIFRQRRKRELCKDPSNAHIADAK